MRHLTKYFIVLVALFGFAFSTVNAEKTTKTKEETKETTTATKDTKSSEKKKVTLYLFRRTGCGHCAAEMTFLDTIVPEYRDKVKIVVYDVTQGSNSELLGNVADALDIGVEGVPFNVIGSQHLEGYAESLNETFKKMLDDAYENQEEDIVAKLIKENNYSNLKATTLYEAMDEEELEYSSKPGSKAKKDGIIIMVVFTVIIVAFGSLIYFSRRK